MVDYLFGQGEPGASIPANAQFVLGAFFPLERMQILQDLFARVHQVGMVITDVEGNWITRMSNASSLCQALQSSPTVRERCELTYRVINETVREACAPVWQECLNCGFFEAGAQIRVGGQHVATCLVGQANPLSVSRLRVEEYAWTMDVDVLRVRNTYSAMARQPVDEFIKSLELFTTYATEVVEQAYRSHLLNEEVNRLRQVETALRQESLNLVRTSAGLRESVSRMAHDLQEVLRSAGDLTDDYDQLKPGIPQTQAQSLMVDMLQKIRRAYRTVLDGMALEKATRTEMEKVLFGEKPGRHRRFNFRGIEVDTGSLLSDVPSKSLAAAAAGKANNEG